MKRLILLFLCLAILVSGCGPSNFDTQTSSSQKNNENESSSSQSNADFPILNEYNYLDYLENSVYAEVASLLGNEDIEVDAIYYSKEYLEECEYNSKENIYFGYTLSELEAQFTGERYYFTVDEEGNTIVEVLDSCNGEFDETVKSLAIRSGVVLLTLTVKVTVGVLTGQTVQVVIGLAKDIVIGALKSGAVVGLIKGFIEGVQTGSLKEGLNTGVLETYEDFTWGAIVGTILP